MPTTGTGRPMSTTSPASEPVPGAPGSLGEQAWIEVIQKMDEVYNDLLQYEVALEEKNAALEESHQFIESIIASMSDILVVCDRNGRIQEVNPAFLRFSGQDEQALKDTSLFDLFADPEERARARHLFAVFAQEGVHDCELHLRGGDGSVMPFSLNCTPRLSPTGKLMGLVLTGRPVGELRRAYQQLRQAHEDLKRTQGQLLHAEKMASLGRLVAGVAHELNNPISFVLGNVLALKRYAQRLGHYLDAVHADPTRAADPGLAARREELRIDRILQDMPQLIEGMIEGAERTRDIVDALKRFSAADRMQPEPVLLAQVVERAVRWVAKSAPARFAIAQEVPPELRCMGSPGQLQQVVMNLVQNACDAAAPAATPWLRISGRCDTGPTGLLAVLEFQDNGPGIAPELLPHLFEPFFTTKPVGQGTGLGLSISYGIVERHGGSLTAENAPEGGARFTLRLPLASN